MENFEEIRMNAMIAITIHYPVESADYLTSQFYEPGYSLTQRTDVLNVNIRYGKFFKLLVQNTYIFLNVKYTICKLILVIKIIYL